MKKEIMDQTLSFPMTKLQKLNHNQIIETKFGSGHLFNSFENRDRYRKKKKKKRSPIYIIKLLNNLAEKYQDRRAMESFWSETLVAITSNDKKKLIFFYLNNKDSKLKSVKY